MTPSPVQRAVERQEESTDSPAAFQQANVTVYGAALPVPVPAEPEPIPVIPAPDVAPPDPDPPEPERHKRQAPTRYEGVVSNTESLEEFSTFAENLEDHYMPFNFEERVFVGKLAEARWFLRRRKRVFESIESALFAAHPDTSKWGEAQFKRLAMAENFRTQGEIAVQRALKKVEEFMLQRIKDYHFETNRDLANRRLDLQQRRCDVAMQNAVMRTTQASGELAEAAPSTKKAVAG
jgi:hypothetical protein